MIYHANTSSFFPWEACLSYTEIMVPILVLYLAWESQWAVVRGDRGPEWELKCRWSRTRRQGGSGWAGIMVRMGFSKERGDCAGRGWRKLQKLKSTRWDGVCLHCSVFILRFLCWFTTEKEKLNPYFCSQPPCPKTGRYEHLRDNCKIASMFLVLWCIYSLASSQRSSSWFSVDVLICPSLFRSWPLSLWPKLLCVEGLLQDISSPWHLPSLARSTTRCVSSSPEEIRKYSSGIFCPFPSTFC